MTGPALETELYEPVKLFLEARGYEVKSEVGPVDVLASRPGAEPLVVELKLGFSLKLLHQAVARQAITDTVYVAVPRWRGKAGWKTFKANVGLCKRLGIGVLSVNLEDQHVQVHADPVPFIPRKSRHRKRKLLREFEGRSGDPNRGGSRGKIVTTYYQQALRCAQHLATHGPSKGSAVAKSADVNRATRIMADNHYGWFERVSRGMYQLSASGHGVLAGENSDPEDLDP